MKNSKEYALKLDKVIRTLKNLIPRISPPEFTDPLEALLMGLFCEHRPDKTARKILKNIQTHFVDLNDLRVSRTEEIVEVLQDNCPQAAQTAKALTHALNCIFDRYDTLSLEHLRNTGKRQAKKDLQEIVASPFAVNFCFLTALGGHAIPVNQQMLDFMKANQLIDADMSQEQIAAFLERHVSAARAWEFYQMLRYGCENPNKITSSEKKTAKPAKKDNKYKPKK